MDFKFRTFALFLVLGIGLILIIRNIYFGEYSGAILSFSVCLTAAAFVACGFNPKNEVVAALAAITVLIGMMTSFGSAMNRTTENGVESQVANQLLQQELCIGEARHVNRVNLLGSCTLEKTAIASDFLADNAVPRGADPITKFSYDTYRTTKEKQINHCLEMLKEINRSCPLNSADLGTDDRELLAKLLAD